MSCRADIFTMISSVLLELLDMNFKLHIGHGGFFDNRASRNLEVQRVILFSRF